MKINGHAYIGRLEDKLESAKDDIITSVCSYATIDDNDDTMGIIDEDSEFYYAGQDQINKYLSKKGYKPGEKIPWEKFEDELTFEDARELYDAIESYGPEGEDYGEIYDELEEKVRDEGYKLENIQRVIDAIGDYVEWIDTSAISISTYVQVKTDYFRDKETGEVELDNFISRGVNEVEVMNDFEPDDLDYWNDVDTVTVRLSDHEPGSRAGDYGRIDYDTGDVDVYVQDY